MTWMRAMKLGSAYSTRGLLVSARTVFSTVPAGTFSTMTSSASTRSTGCAPTDRATGSGSMPARSLIRTSSTTNDCCSPARGGTKGAPAPTPVPANTKTPTSRMLVDTRRMQFSLLSSALPRHPSLRTQPWEGRFPRWDRPILPAEGLQWNRETEQCGEVTVAQPRAGWDGGRAHRPAGPAAGR